MIALLPKGCPLFSRELLAPWRLASLVFGLGLLIAGSVFLPSMDWDVPLCFVMGIPAYILAPWAFRQFWYLRWKWMPCALLAVLDPERKPLPDDVIEQVVINVRYEGYIERQKQQVEHFKKLENRKIPADFDYDAVPSIRLEARQKLKQFRPINVGQASRISGVSPADISVLLVMLERVLKGGHEADDRNVD